ncbi:unnamed protein product [Lactuca saligna]|uniref:TIR domain-containing protein n=1 Tax=Lactuca saligna TaxID=75948 RepID=A0AA35ZQK8_LACSI|nr:unnamed protein product [Lactuca saligna]
MVSPSSSPSAPAFSSVFWKYDVFLSFRGEDTRNTFVGHLYSALEQEGIFAYKDDETLPRGESIHPSLMKAIEESQIAIIVFSKNYCDSSWCLDELSYIMKCRDTRGQIVMPIFYDVDPAQVRKPKRKYGEVFAKHELDNKTKVESWRKALVDASNLSGWEPKHIANGHEAKGIKQIVVEISWKLQPATSSANENLIGIDARLQGLKLELQIGSGGVIMIGIWGVGGGGKTTLASSIYNEISTKFDSCCFVENIREESGRYGLGKLKEKILSEMGVNRAGGGRWLINNRFRHRKVLIVLDDVDNLDQLKALAGSHDWFGEGSRIIITTRDKHLLTAHKVNAVYNIRLLNSDEAIKLFYKHAPRDKRPVEDYDHLSKEVITYAGGLPLALTVLGSFLCDKDIHEWRSALARLKEIPDTDIVEKLKISFDGLKPIEKELFLDIACFFRRERKDKAMKILGECGFHPVIGVKVLIQKALITISEYGEFDMHDLVQEMGHHIVRGEHPNNPEKHSRIWKEEDVLKICAMDATTELEMIEAIKVRYNMAYSYLPIAANMKNLRWIEYAGEFMPSNFPQRKLCRLILFNSLQKQLWEGYKLLPYLKTIELRQLDNLIMTPDFDGLPNLERFILDRCWRLKEIHPSIGRLEKLILIWIQEENKESLPHVHLDDNSGSEVASSIGSCPDFFVNCWRCGCSNLPGVECCLMEPSSPHNNVKHFLRDINMNHIGLRFFLKNLRKLDLSFCSLGDKEIGSAVWELPNLRKLYLSGNHFSQLNFSFLQVPQLKLLDVSCCQGLVKLSDLPSSIAVVLAIGCFSLESLGDISNCKWLWNVSILGNNKLVGCILLDSMLQGNAIEVYFINIILKPQVPNRFVGRLFRGTFTLLLPDDWYNEYCGFLVCVVTQIYCPCINIVMKQEVYEENSLFELLRESNEAVEPIYDGTRTFIGYVSFGSLRHTTFPNSSYNMISFSLKVMDWNLLKNGNYVGAELVPRKSKGDQLQTTKVATDSSEFLDEEKVYARKTFTIQVQHDSKSSINIIWRPMENRF